MLSPPDLAVIGVLALIFFGPDQLPKVARKAGAVMREVQNTSHSFIREMERAADDIEAREAAEKAYTPSTPARVNDEFVEPTFGREYDTRATAVPAPTHVDEGPSLFDYADDGATMRPLSPSTHGAEHENASGI